MPFWTRLFDFRLNILVLLGSPALDLPLAVVLQLFDRPFYAAADDVTAVAARVESNGCGTAGNLNGLAAAATFEIDGVLAVTLDADRAGRGD